MNKQEGGYFLVSAVVMILFLTGVGVAIAALSTAQYQHVKRQVFAENAQLVAEAGIEQSVHQLNTNDSFGGYTTEQQFFDNSTQGRGTYTTTITDNADGKSKALICAWRSYVGGLATGAVQPGLSPLPPLPP